MPVTSPAAGGTPIDVAALEDLVGRDPDVIREFLRAFWTSTAATAAELRAALDARNAPLVGSLAHRLKSPSKSVGARDLAKVCEELEAAGRGGDLEAVTGLMPRFLGEEARVEAYLRER